MDDRALAGRPGDVEGRGGVAEKIRDVAQLEVVIAVNICLLYTSDAADD